MQTFITTSSTPTSSSYSKSFMEEKLNHLQLPPEIEEGNVEYKLHLIDPSPERLEHLVSQLKWRLAEGHGEAMYEIGVSDKGELIGISEPHLEASISTLTKMGKELQAEISTVREQIVSKENEPVRKVAEILIRKSIEDDQHFLEIRVAIIGGHDAGKSTLLGVLSKGDLDNGRGKARLNLLRHPHEIETGRTSSISRQIIGFNPTGELVNFATTNVTSWEQVCEVSSKIISFLDTCGHPKYQRTTISGLTGRTPDYACLIINANGGGISEVSREHLGIAVVLKVPIMIVITKIDIATSEQLTKTLQALFQVLKSPGLRRMPVIMKNKDDVVVSVTNFISSSIIPIFLTSCATGENVNLFTQFLNLLPKPLRDYDTLLSEDPEYQIEEIYSVPDVGTVVGGVLMTGQLRLGHRSNSAKIYYIGPNRGRFVPCTIHSIHRQRCPVTTIKAGQAATCAIRLIRSNEDEDIFTMDEEGSSSSSSESSIKLREPKFKFRKGQVILNHPPSLAAKNVSAKVTWEFDAEIHVLYHRGVLCNMFQGTLYFGSVRQSARIIHVYEVFSDKPNESGVVSSKELKTGRKGRVRLRFTNEPEWIRLGWTVLFREGRTKCVGKVTGLHAS